MGRKKRQQKLAEVKRFLAEKTGEEVRLDADRPKTELDKIVSEVIAESKPKEPKKPVRGTLIENKVVIREDFVEALEYYDKSCFGDITGVKEKMLELSLVEALYLYERGKLIILDTNGKTLSFEKVIDYAKKVEHNFWTRWCVFRDFRTRGYVLKTALKFGHDFRVYPRGMKPGEEHAKWALFCVAENDTENWRQFAAKMRVAHSTKKITLIGCVDDEGDTTYWEIRWRTP